MITPIDQPVDDLADLTNEEKTALAEWESHFKTKYILVGRVVD